MIQINPGNSRNMSLTISFFVMFSKYSSTWVEYACVDVHPCVLMSCSISSEVAPLNTRPLLGFPLLTSLPTLPRLHPAVYVTSHISIISRCQCQPRVKWILSFVDIKCVLYYFVSGKNQKNIPLFPLCALPLIALSKHVISNMYAPSVRILRFADLMHI